MSLLPIILRDMMSMSRPFRMLENHMRLTEELLQPFLAETLRMQKQQAMEYPEEQESIIHDKEKFQIKLDMQNFAPEEIVVKSVGGNAVQIEAKHEKEGEKGFMSRQLVRKFVLPTDHDVKNIISNLSSDGILTVTAPKVVDSNAQETIIKINHTGPEREMKNKENKKSDLNTM